MLQARWSAGIELPASARCSYQAKSINSLHVFFAGLAADTPVVMDDNDEHGTAGSPAAGW
jgi:hypothetical protein